jgi:hypothetical protein
MKLDAFPDELVHLIVMELHSIVVADQAFYLSRRQRSERKVVGIYWTHTHLVPVSVVNRQFRRVSSPILFASVDVALEARVSAEKEELRRLNADAKQLILKIVSLRSQISAAIR